MSMLLAGRALQGAAGGGLLQMSTVVIADMFSMRRRTLWLGLLEVVWAIAGGSGPVIGGVTATTIGWQWNFWINLRKNHNDPTISY
jgi:MFS family permease